MAQNIISKILVTILLVAVVTLIENAINLKRESRHKQAFFPIVALIYSVIAIVLTLILNDQFCDYFNKSEFFANGTVAMMNVILMAGFVIVKALLLKLFDRANGTSKHLGKIVERVYEYDVVYSRWYLKDEWTNYRQLALAYVAGGVIACGVVLGLVWGLGENSKVWLYAFPCVALIVINEISNFLNGLTRAELGNMLRGDESFSVRVAQFFRVREILEGLFPAQILSSHTGCEFIESEGATNSLDELNNSEDRIDRITAAHFALKNEEDVLDTDAIQATVELMHEKSVIFFNPFYRDLGDYIALPVADALLADKKCLIVTSRSTTCEDVAGWMKELLQKYCKVPSLWKIGKLGEKFTDYNIGILSFGQMYNLSIIEANREFFHSVDFVLLIEPSLIINTAQLAISIISDEISSEDGKPVYCICDRKVNGLVDTMSHLLRTEIVEIAATPVPRNIYTGMTWNANGDYMRQRLFGKQTKYLGNGTEIAAVAIKNQIPKVTWYSETKTPVKDLKWIVGQFYSSICRYMNIPPQQKILQEKLSFVSNLWCAPSEKEQFIIVEDEFCNMFSTLDIYLSRNSNQIFVNVLAEDYLLRDYMRCNREMFVSNPNAVPSLAPDYAKTERNTIMKLILTMAYRSMSEKEILQELRLVDIETSDVFATLTKLILRYTDSDDTVFTVRNLIKNSEDGIHNENDFSISKAAFEMCFANTLKNAYFIIEDEKGDTEFVDAKLFGHIAQSMLPGQFITYAGKYYEVKLISPEVGVVLHRTSDLYDDRKYYRQIRTYVFEKPDEDYVVSTRKVLDMEISTVCYTFEVNTTGYLEMRDNHDLRTAKLIDFSEDKLTETVKRRHKNKNVLRIKFPDTTENVRFTICILLSELLRSVFPDAWQYVAVTTKYSDDVEGVLNYMMYTLEGALDGDDEYIYIIEDSTMDLGLLEAIERKIDVLFEIIADYLEWHVEKMRESGFKDPVLYTVALPKEEKKAIEREAKSKNAFRRLFDRLLSVFKPKKDEEDETKANAAASSDGKEENGEEHIANDVSEVAGEANDGTAMEAENTDSDADEDDDAESESGAVPMTEEIVNNSERFTEESEENASTANEPVQQSEPAEDFNSGDYGAELLHVDGTDIFEEDDGATDSELFLDMLFAENNVPAIKKSRYQRECFLMFGFDEIDSRICIKDVIYLLRARGLTENSLTRARKRKVYSDEENAEQRGTIVNRCDFCGAPLNGVSYERLFDGRIRCNDCSSSAINTEDDFSRLFVKTVEMMEGIFNILYNIPINVEMTDAATIAASTGRVFVPSVEFAGRALGYATCNKGHYSMVVENGSPRLACISTVVHEMTHIWQYINWTPEMVEKMAQKYGPGAIDAIYEGMAMWASIQFMYCTGETYFAFNQELEALDRNDIYGIGLKLFCNEYPLQRDGSVIKCSPFSKFPPLDISL